MVSSAASVGRGRDAATVIHGAPTFGPSNVTLLLVHEPDRPHSRGALGHHRGGKGAWLGPALAGLPAAGTIQLRAPWVTHQDATVIGAPTLLLV